MTGRPKEERREPESIITTKKYVLKWLISCGCCRHCPVTNHEFQCIQKSQEILHYEVVWLMEPHWFDCVIVDKKISDLEAYDFMMWHFLVAFSFPDICFVFQTQGQLRNSSNRADFDLNVGPLAKGWSALPPTPLVTWQLSVVRGPHKRHIYLIYPISELRISVWHLAALTCDLTLRLLAVKCILGGMSSLLQAFLASCHVDCGSHGEKPNGLRLRSMSFKCFPPSPVCCSSASTLK